MKIGFCGLGQMGRPMALNLLKSGAELMVHDIRSEPFADLERRGAKMTRELANLADCDVVFLSLPNGEVVEETLIGERGLGAKLRPDRIVVDTSTIAYGSTMKIAPGNWVMSRMPPSVRSSLSSSCSFDAASCLGSEFSSPDADCPCNCLR